MKTTDFIKESIGEDADNMHRDHEVQMARSDCYNAARYAIELHKMLHHVAEQQGLEGWVSEKITLANDYLRTVWEYLRHEGAGDEQQQAMMPAFSFENAEQQFDELLKEDAVDDFLARGGQIQHGKLHKARKAEKWQGSSHIGTGRGGKAQSMSGKAANTNPKGNKPVVTADIHGVAEGEPGDLEHELERQDYERDAQRDAAAEKQANKKVAESMSAGGTGVGAVAVSVSGTGRPTTGKPKANIANAIKRAKPKFGKGIY